MSFKAVVLSCAACRAVSEVSSFFDRPLISWVATDPDFDDKVAYSTLSRTLGPFSKLADFLLEVFLQYNWRRVVVISSNYLLYWDAGKAIRKIFSESNITVAYSSVFNRFPSDDYIQNTLYKTSVEGRSGLSAFRCQLSFVCNNLDYCDFKVSYSGKMKFVCVEIPIPA